MQVNALPYRSPNLNCYAERFVQAIGRECLDRFVVFGADGRVYQTDEPVWHEQRVTGVSR